MKTTLKHSLLTSSGGMCKLSKTLILRQAFSLMTTMRRGPKGKGVASIGSQVGLKVWILALLKNLSQERARQSLLELI
jgi:hypothetical protein